MILIDLNRQAGTKQDKNKDNFTRIKSDNFG